jgi:glutamyl-tRNA synthetase
VGRLAYAAGLIDRPEPIRASELIPLFDLSVLPRDDITIQW